MSHIRLHLFSLFVLLTACGVPPNEQAARSLELSASDAAVQTMLPARVSVSFTVDTSDGQPVAGLTNDSFEIFEDGARVSPYESQRSIQPRGQKARMYSLLLLDLSGSILRSGEFASVQEAATAYVDRVLATGAEAHRLAVYSFDGRESISKVVGFTNDAAALKNGIYNLGLRECSTNSDCAAHADRKSCAGWLCVDESTNLNGAVIAGLDTLLSEQDADTAISFKESALVVFTDGTDQAARVSAAQTKKAVLSSSAHVFTLGLGGEVDSGALSEFGKDGFEPVSDADQLHKAFDAIASRINAMANRFYVLDYCSPKRSGSHELKLVAHWTGPDGVQLDGSLTRTFDATGFGSGCEIAAQ